MDYTLCKKLKEAGFKQPEGDHAVDYDGYWFNNARKVAEGVDLMKEGTDPVYEPTLSELIGACGDDFKELRNFRREMWAYHGKEKGERQYRKGWPDGNDWVAEAVSTYSSDEGTTGPISSSGKTPEEAVAKLWLALNEKFHDLQ